MNVQPNQKKPKRPLRFWGPVFLAALFVFLITLGLGEVFTDRYCKDFVLEAGGWLCVPTGQPQWPNYVYTIYRWLYILSAYVAIAIIAMAWLRLIFGAWKEAFGDIVHGIGRLFLFSAGASAVIFENLRNWLFGK